MDEKINLLDLSMEELEGLALKLGEEKYRGRQVFKWLYRGVKDIDLMTDLSKAFREVLKEKAFIGGARVADKRVSKVDGTAKYLLELHDGNMIESVLMEYKYGLSICVSSQVGCRMGCRFCASSGVGFVRNLSPGEMLDQVLLLQADRGERIGHVVIMGIGEPLDNYDNVLKFLRTVNHPEGLNISYRNISLSTCGLVPRIIRLARVKIPITLSVSLHAPNDEVRRKLMPVALKYSIDKLIEACKIYTEITGRRVSFEYALISGLNDSVRDAAELSRRLKGMLCHVNLIPVNKVVGRQYTRSSYKTIERFRDVLAEHGIQATVRRELGSDIEAACGQLRRSVMAKRQPPGDGKDGQ